MARRRKRPQPTISTPEIRDETSLLEDEDTTALAVRSEAPLAQDETSFLTPLRPGASNVTETTGRTWPDVVYPYSSNQKYLYLAVLLLIVLGFGTTGHLATLKEALITAGAIGVAWLVLYVIQRNR